ncbi:MAG: putative CoA-transferase beta subunit [Frankiales bacterium]|nr:putative CoA-transferase beta subunit [Frankiales bacterium]
MSSVSNGGTPDLGAPASMREIMATVIANDIVDGEWVEVGANLPVPRAGALLAHLTHGPNLTVMIAMTKAYLRDVPVIEEFEYITDVRAQRWAEAHYRHDWLLMAQRLRGNGVFYAGGVQIDALGNSNLIGVGTDHRRLKFRGPGGIGTCNATMQSARWHLVTTTHSTRVLVPKVDFISALGYGDGTADFRAELGLPQHGPDLLITPLCVFDFPLELRRARLKTIHPGVSLEQVRTQTGFDYDVIDDLQRTTGPTAEQLTVLRTRIDTAGTLRNDTGKV